MGVPFGSTMHYQVLFLIDLLGLKGSVKLVDMAPTEIIAAWDDPERHPSIIDAAACWGRARDHVLQGGVNTLAAHTLLSAGVLSDWGRPTFVVVAVTRTFEMVHPGFVRHFVGVLSRISDSFLDRLGEEDARNVQRWDAQETPGTSNVASMVDALMLPDQEPGAPSNEQLFKDRRALDAFVQYSASEQLSCQLLGPGPNLCHSPTMQHLAVRQTAEFLLDQKVLATLGPLDHMGDEQGGACQGSSTFCGSDIIDGTYLKVARQTCTSCLPVGPYAGMTPDVSSSDRGDPDGLLFRLEQMDNITGRSPFASSEIGRDVIGDSSSCLNRNGPNIISSSNRNEVIGQFGDGANGLVGRSYSDNLSCQWQIRGTDCNTESDGCESLVELHFETLRVWSGDRIRVYSDPDFKCDSSSSVLLAQVSGVYGESDQLPPRIRAVGCMLVVFETDPNQERTYGDDSGDGFVASYDRNSIGCQSNSDCNGERCNQGMCECGGTKWGADCSERKHCFGKTHIRLFEDESQIVTSSVGLLYSASLTNDPVPNSASRDPLEAYPNDLDCTFDIVANGEFKLLQLAIFYDLEPAYDLLWLQSGSDGSPSGKTNYAVLTGNHSTPAVPEVYFLPLDGGKASLRLTTDARGRRLGFRAEVQAVRDVVKASAPEYRSENPCLVSGSSGYACDFPHCITQNRLAPAMSRPSSSYVLGRVVSQTPGLPVQPMPWERDGGCTWPLLHAGFNTWDIVALRLIFNFPLDLEPHPVSAVGDKLVVRKEVNSIFEDTAIFIEECDSDELCSYPWQTGKCVNRGCTVRNAVEVPLTGDEILAGASPSAVLVTDRNDGGNIYRGLDFDVLVVQKCPYGDMETHCETGGGKCVDGFCFCKGGNPCSCSCDGEVPETISTGVKIGFVLGIVVPTFLAFIVCFLCYRRRKLRKIRKQKTIIKAKDEELDAFRNSVVGMRTAIKNYIPRVPKKAIPEGAIDSAVSCISVTWCWKETRSCMDQHGPDDIVGDPTDCWIKYDKDSSAKLEAAFQEQGACGEYSPLPGYIVDFSTMIQTKVATGFHREVQRLAQQDPPLDIDLKDVQVGDELPVELEGEPQMVLVTGDIIQIAKQRPDGWAFGTALNHADGAVSRHLVSVAVAGSTADDSAILTDTGWFSLAATRVPSGDDLAALQKQVGDTGELAPPSCWDPVSDPTVVERHELQIGDPERTAVEGAFLSTLQPPAFNHVKVVRIDRIQNLAMWQSYCVKRQTICYRESSNESSGADPAANAKALERFERRWVWHGTNVEVMDKILQQGFNRSFCGKNATAYGKGVYFARDAEYSAYKRYAVPDSNGIQYMMACRVVVGEYCRGRMDALTPDLRDPTKNILYDSTVGLIGNDNMANPSIYVTYHDAQAYAEYLIAFRAS